MTTEIRVPAQQNCSNESVCGLVTVNYIHKDRDSWATLAEGYFVQ